MLVRQKGKRVSKGTTCIRRQSAGKLDFLARPGVSTRESWDSVRDSKH